MITKALDDGANVNAVSSTSGSTALHLVTAVGRPYDNGKLLPIADLLISRGANVNLQNRDGMTPLMWAVLAGNIEMMKRLLDAGADITIKHSNGQTALDMAREDFPQGLRLLEERQAAANPITAIASAVASAVAPARNPDEDPKLLVAVLRGDIEGVRAALAAGADVNTTGVSPLKNTPLHHAVISHVDFREKMYPIVDLLLEKGANVNAQRSGDGHTPFTLSFHDPKFFYALFQKRPDLTLKIKEAPQNMEETPFQYATRRFAARPEKRYLADVIAKAELGEWDGAIAIAREEADIPAPASPVAAVAEAVQSAVASVVAPSAPVPNSDHNRALQAAVAANDDAAARAAILAGANPNLMINGNQETMLIHYAATENRPMVEFLLDHGADVNGRAGPAAEEPGWTALNYSRYFDVGEYIEERGGLTARLLDGGPAASQINFPPAVSGPRSGEQRLQGREDLIIPPITLVEGYATGESDGDAMDAIDVKEVYVAKLGRTLTLDQFFRKYMGDGAVFKVGPKFYGIPRKDLLKEYLEGSAIAYECTKTFAMDDPDTRGTFEYSDIYAAPYYALRTPAGVLYVSLSIMRIILGTTHAFFKLDDKPSKKLENIASRSSVIAGGPVSSQLHCQAGSDGNVYTIRFFKLPEIEEEEETDEEDEPNVVFVKKGEDKTEFPLDLSQTVLQLKEAVKEKLGIAVEAQKMLFQGKVLKDDQTLGEANVKKGYTIQLQVSGGRKKRKTFRKKKAQRKTRKSRR